MKTIFINHTNNCFGAEQVMLKLLDCCPLEKEEIIVVEPSYTEQSGFAEKISEKQLRLIRLKYKNIGGSIWRSLLVILYNIPALIKLIGLAKKEKVQCVYSNTSVTCLGIMLAKCLKVKHIWHIHEPVEREHGFSHQIVPLYRHYLCYRKNTIVFAAQKQQKQWLSLFPGINSIVIDNPINDCSVRHKVENRVCRFGFVGSMDKRKNVPSIINAFEKLLDENKEYRLYLTKNTGDEEQVVSDMIKAKKMEYAVSVERYANIADMFRQIDVLLLPSFSETWGMVVLEAMICGIPSVVTTHSGLTNLLTDNEEVIFVDPYDIDALTNAMRRIADPKVQERLSEKGKKLLENKDFNGNFIKKVTMLFEQ